MVREKLLKITLNWKGISYLRTSVCYCGRMRLLCAKFWGPYSFPLGSSANFASDVQQSYWSRHTNTVYIVREENSAAENLRTSRYKLGPIIFHFKTFLWQNVASKKFLKTLKVLMNLRANGAQNCRRNEQFLSPLQHKTRVRHFWTSKSETLTWNILLYVGKPLFCIDSSLRSYFWSGCGVMSSTTRDNKRDYNVWALRNSFLTKEIFWCFYIAFKDIKYTSKLDSLVLTTILSFLCQYFERNGIQAWARKLTVHVMTIMALWQTIATMPSPWSIPSTPQWQTIFRSTSMMNRFTHSTHDEPFHPCYKWQTISSMLLITNHCTNVLMTNQQTHPFHGKSLQSCHHHKPFQPSHLWQTISPFHTWQTISPKLPMTNHFGFAIHEKLFPPITHIKKLDPWCPREKPMKLCHHQKFFHPFNPWQAISPILPWQITSPMLLMTISHVPFLLTMSPIPPGQTIPPMLPITNLFTHPIHDIPFISKQKRYFTHPMFLCRGVTFPALSFFGNGWDHVAIDSSVIRLKVARE